MEDHYDGLGFHFIAVVSRNMTEDYDRINVCMGLSDGGYLDGDSFLLSKARAKCL